MTDKTQSIHQFQDYDEYQFALARNLLAGIFPNMESRNDTGKTPERFVKMLRELAAREDFEFTTFASDSDEMVIVQDIPFVSLCAHHIAPFIGKVHIAYVPKGKIAGLSKFVRAVNFCAKGLWCQEELTNELTSYLEEHLDPVGVGVIMQAEHTCMTIRGVKTYGSLTTTSRMTGCFADHSKLARAEFMSIVGLR